MVYFYGGGGGGRGERVNITSHNPLSLSLQFRPDTTSWLMQSILKVRQARCLPSRALVRACQHVIVWASVLVHVCVCVSVCLSVCACSRVCISIDRTYHTVSICLCSSTGIWLYSLTCQDYQDLLDRGFRRYCIS